MGIMLLCIMRNGTRTVRYGESKDYRAGFTDCFCFMMNQPLLGIRTTVLKTESPVFHYSFVRKMEGQ